MEAEGENVGTQLLNSIRVKLPLTFGWGSAYNIVQPKTEFCFHRKSEKGKIVIPATAYFSIKTSVIKPHQIILSGSADVFPVCTAKNNKRAIVIDAAGFI